MAARGALAALALVLVAWLGLMERNARLQANGVAEIAKAERSRSGARATSDFTRARFLNPDRTPYLLLGNLYLSRGLPVYASGVANELVKDEPENVLAWRLMLESNRGLNGRAVRRAARALHRLDPRDFPD